MRRRGPQVFHWLVSDRVEYLETTPAESRLQHFRIVMFMALLLVSAAAAPRRSRRSPDPAPAGLPPRASAPP